MKEDKMLSIATEYVDAYNLYDLDRMLSFLDENVHFYNTFQGILNRNTKGILAFREQAKLSIELFENREQKITGIVLKPESVTLSISFTGVAKKKLGQQLRKGDVIYASGKSTFEFKEDKIIRIEDVS
jgi:hypothetical protein